MLNTQFTVVNDWPNGFQGAISLMEENGSSTSGWQISFTATFEITHIWGAQIVSRDGDRYTIEAMPWNSDIQPGQSIDIGFTGIPESSDIAISDVELNSESFYPDLPEPEPELTPVMPVFAIADEEDDLPPQSPVPEVSIGSGSVSEGDPYSTGTVGWFSTDGARIVDETGTEVRLTGVNWFGAETTRGTPDGLHSRNWQDLMDQISDLGFNTIRLPFSNDALRPGAMPSGINYNLNSDLTGLTSLEIIDEVVSYAAEIGLRIILDNHRNAAGDGASPNGLWYGEGYSQADWITDWQMLAARYADNPTVVGFDLSNEPHSASWGSGDVSTDWRLGAEAAIEAIHDINPNVLVLVEGIGGDYWWGGNLKGVENAPVRLDQNDKLVYSPHAYPNSIYNQPWFSDPSFPDNMPEVWDHNWGYIAREEIAPILVGEFGSRLLDPKDVEWFDAFIPYLEQTGVSWTFWSLNPNSGDTGGILEDDWRTPISEKIDLLEPVLGDDLGIGSGGEETMLPTPSIADNSVSEDVEDVSAEQSSLTLDAGDEVFIFDSGMVTPTSDQTVALVNTQTDESENDNEMAPVPTPTSSDTNGDSVFSELRVDDNWGTGFVARGSIVNDSDTAVDGWSVVVTTKAEIGNIWNAQILSQNGDTYLIGAVDYDEHIGAGDSVSWGFQAAGNYSLDYGDVII
jgi:aryl-phospho-beta-D-glucosidase BglC (GH1 family)